MTNALPIHRLLLPVGGQAAAPAVYMRAVALRVERLEQTYTRCDDRAGSQQFKYEAPAFDFECRLLYDNSGLVLQYPGIATRAA